MAMKIGGYTYDYTTVNAGIPGVANDRVNEELQGISLQGSTEGRDVYHGSKIDGSGINDGRRKLSGSFKMSVELFSEIVKSPQFAATGYDMAEPFDMSITVQANIPPYTSSLFEIKGVRLGLVSADWQNGSSSLPIDMPYMCLERTLDGVPC